MCALPNYWTVERLASHFVLLYVNHKRNNTVTLFNFNFSGLFIFKAVVFIFQTVFFSFKRSFFFFKRSFYISNSHPFSFKHSFSLSNCHFFLSNDLFFSFKQSFSLSNGLFSSKRSFFTVYFFSFPSCQCCLKVSTKTTQQ